MSNPYYRVRKSTQNIRMRFAAPLRKPALTPALEPLEARCLLSGDGLTASYFKTVDLTGPAITQIDPKVDFNWGAGSPDPSIPVNRFSARWEGYLVPQFTERYTLYAGSDDGVRVFLNGQKIIDGWRDRGYTTDSAQIDLVAGRLYAVTVEFYEKTGGASVRFEWSSASQPRAVVPTESLFSQLPQGEFAPQAPKIKKPSVDGTLVNPTSTLFETQLFIDINAGDLHRSTDWEVVDVATGETIWTADDITDPTNRVRITMADGNFVGSYTGRTDFQPDTDYALRVRFRSTGGAPDFEYSDWSTRLFRTGQTLAPDLNLPQWVVGRPGYVVETVATGFQLPVNIAFVPNPGDSPTSPLYYVNELYGNIKVVTQSGIVSDFASDLLNFNPTGNFPGSGEIGLAGLVVDPLSGDLFVSLLFKAADGQLYPKVDRLHPTPDGLAFDRRTTLLEMYGHPQGAAHQVSNLTFGPDGYLYVHNGDAFDSDTARDLDLYLGKILRMDRDGQPAPTNPFYDPSDGISSRDYIVASGFRNPFGGDWRDSDGAHYTVENGPSIDRLSKLTIGRDYLYDGTDESMLNYAVYNWMNARAPVNIAFVQPTRFAGSGFPDSVQDHAFVSESGPTWADGPIRNAKRIAEFIIDANGGYVSGPTSFVEYNGAGKASVVALAAGPDGLYFSDFYKDDSFDNPIARGSNILRVRYVGAVDFQADTPIATAAPLAIQFTDISDRQNHTGWLWDFGDGNTSTLRNPSHTYLTPGVYDVSLQVTSADGAVTTNLKRGYVRIAANGLAATYFNDPDLAVPRFSRIDPNINFTWGFGSPEPSIGTNNFSIRWTGAIIPAFSESYTFVTTADDGVRLWIDENLIIDAWNLTGVNTRQATLPLVAGRAHSIRLEYKDLLGDASARLEWQSASQPRQIIPSSRLAPVADPSLRWSNPAVGQQFAPGVTIPLDVTPFNISQPIVAVDFYDGTTLIGTSTDAPYSLAWLGASLGDHQLTAQARTAGGQVITSPPLPIAVSGPTLSISDASRVEGQSLTRSMLFTVSLSSPSPTDTVTVQFTTVDGSALAGSDYVSRNDLIIFRPGESSRTVEVVINGDTIIEPDETFQVHLSNPTGASLARSTATGTILTDEISLTVMNVSVREGDLGATTPATFLVKLNVAAPFDVVFRYETADATASVSGGDYTPRSGTLTIPAGQLSVPIPVDILGDNTPEPLETLQFKITTATNAILARPLATATILDDDLPFSIADASILEGDSGTLLATLEVTLATAVDFPVSIPYKTGGGTATPGVDYTAVSGTLEFAPGVTRLLVSIPISGDSLVEPDETIRVQLQPSFFSNSARNAAFLTLRNDDLTLDFAFNPLIQVVPGPIIIEGDSGFQNIQVDVLLSQAASFAVFVNFTTTNDTAIAPLDFRASAGTLAFRPGQTRSTISIDILGDLMPEALEQFFVDLFNPVNAVIKRSRLVLQIEDNDV